MNIVMEALRSRGAKPALVAAGGSPLSGHEAVTGAQRLAEGLAKRGSSCAALYLDNRPEWVIADLACQLAEIPMVPIPGFFTPGQIRHALWSAGVDTLIGDDPGLEPEFEPRGRLDPGLGVWQRPPQPSPIPPGTARVTYTSGTTGEPKGVCLTQAAMERVAVALADTLSGLAGQRHLAVLPLSVLLENVAGVYAGILLGSEIALPGCGDTGLEGSSNFRADKLVGAIGTYRPDSLVLLPQMLRGLVAELTRQGRRLTGLAFAAVGGARTAPDLIVRARALGIPVYEGYGLTECSSVVALNTPGNDRPGSVGKVLPHLQVRVEADGEFLVGRHVPYRYAGEPAPANGWLATGDLGWIDRDGFLFISGRKQETLVTAYGRNVSPEWVESELLAQPGIDQAMVFGDALPALGALVAPARGTPASQTDQQLEDANRRLPDYARITAWREVPHFLAESGQLTANGRLRRDRIRESHSALIAELSREIEQHQQETSDDLLRNPC